MPLNTTVTITETAAPEGYTLLPAKTVNTGSKGGQTVELKLANSDDHTFKVHKISSADGRNLMGATFEVRGIDNNFKHTYTTDALGEFEIAAATCRPALSRYTKSPRRRLRYRWFGHSDLRMGQHQGHRAVL